MALFAPASSTFFEGGVARPRVARHIHQIQNGVRVAGIVRDGVVVQESEIQKRSYPNVFGGQHSGWARRWTASVGEGSALSVVANARAVRFTRMRLSDASYQNKGTGGSVPREGEGAPPRETPPRAQRLFFGMVLATRPAEPESIGHPIEARPVRRASAWKQIFAANE